MKSLRGVRWLTLILVSVVATLVVSLLASNWNDFVTFPWRLNLDYLVLTLVFHSLALGTTFFVWHLMVIRLSGFSDLGLNVRFYYVSTLAKRVPISVWYIGSRLVMYKQAGVSGSSILNGILLENVLVGLGGIFTFVLFLPTYSAIPSAVALPISAVGVLLILTMLARPRLFIDITNKVLRRFRKQELDKVPARRDILLWSMLYTLPWFFAGFSLLSAVRTFSDNLEPGITDSIGISTLTMLVALLSMILPGGFGLKELTSSVLLSSFMPLSAAVVISITYRLLQTLNEILWALGSTMISPSRMPRTKDIDLSERVIDDQDRA